MLYKNNESIMERFLRFIIALIVVMSLAIPVITPGVFAASLVNISGGDNVKGGDTFTVAVTFGGGDVGRVDAQLLYDTDQLTYLSGGTSKGNTGYIQLKSAGTEGAIVFNIKFQAVSDGSADLSVTTNEMYDLDEMAMDTPSATKTINITGSAQEDQLITEPADEEQPEEETSLAGVDEIIGDEEEAQDSGNSVLRIIIISSVVLVVLIIALSIIISKNKRKRKRSRRHR